MAETDENRILCKSVFKSGKNTISKTQFTEKWIELINKTEKYKESDFTK